MKKTLTLFTLLLFAIVLKAEEPVKNPFSIGATFKSRYILRGSMISNTFNLLPSISYSKGGFNAEVLGVYSVNGDYAEVGLFASYQYKFMKIGVADYFFPNENNAMNNYFSSQHMTEVRLKFCGLKKVPVYFDAWLTLNGDNKQYTSYMEAGYSLALKKYAQNIDFFAGFTPYKGNYADKFNFINVGAKLTKNIALTDKYSISVYSKLIVNPYKENVYLVFGMTI
ncbi:MAG: hypothetical protein N4A72_05805 [Bacteroidales bacterium]|jgi:hypothetical protein|nr:hypothetical protein [Bacteroidales bacterium]